MSLPGFEVTEDFGGNEFRLCRARRTSEGDLVLLKMGRLGDPSGSRRKMFLELEFETCSGLDVDGVLTVLDFLVKDDWAVLVLRDVPGIPLDRLLKGHREPMRLETALEVSRNLSLVLSGLHERGHVHRDLRATDVLFDEASGKTHVTGLGRALQGGGDERRPDVLQGDPTYLAPEATGRLDRQLDHRADLYSLGVMLFEMLTGRPPFDAPDPVARVHAHLALEPPEASELRPDLPASVSAIIEKLLAKAAEERYQSSLGLAHDLSRCLADLEDGGKIRPFEPGERDVGERFELPQTLFGREAESRWLEEALESVASAQQPIVRLVAGYSGVGKTALVEDFRASVMRRDGLFTVGTFDPIERTTPYSALQTALRGLVWQRLGATPERIQVWTSRLTEALGPNLGVVTQLVPELQNLLKEVPSIPPVQPENVRSRFYHCVSQAFGTFVDENAPLVLFLDDLQWVDSASLELISSLLTRDASPFLLLGAYRDHEVDEDHPLARTLARLEARQVEVETLRLLPLGEPALRQLIAETLRLAPPAVAPLAEVVYRKTAGNPFFVRTFMLSIYKGQLLRLEASAGQGDSRPWTWDLERIVSLETAENVVDLIAHQLTELPPVNRQALAVASVLGQRVDAATLVEICSSGDPLTPLRDSTQAEGILTDACRQGLLVRTAGFSWEQEDENPQYAFVHDRVREGAYNLLSAEERTEVHLRIGRLLRDREIGRRTFGGKDLFKAVDHLNHATSRITDPAERRGLVRLGAEVGRQARAEGAFRAAFAYLNSALTLLVDPSRDGKTDPWQEDYELTQGLCAQAAETAALAGDFEAAEELCLELREKARNLLDTVPAYETQIYMRYARRQLETATSLALEILGRLGMKLPRHPEASELQAAVLAADRAVEIVLDRVEQGSLSDLPVMSDPEHLAIARLLARVVVIGAWTPSRLFRLASCRLAELTAAHGVGPVAPLAYVLMAEVRCSELEDFSAGRRVGELALALAELPDAKGLRPVCQLMFDIAVSARFGHPTEFRQRLAKLFRGCLESGDLIMTAALCFQDSLAGFVSGTELPRVEAEARKAQIRARDLGQQLLADVIERLVRLDGALLGRLSLEEALDMGHVAPESVGVDFRLRVIGPEMMVRCLMRDSEAMVTARESQVMAKGTLAIFPYDFYRCLILLDHGARDDPELVTGVSTLEKRARVAPKVYEHKLDLVKAHRLRATGLGDQALPLYQQAWEGARRGGFLQDEALAIELAAELCHELGRQREAAARFREAASVYRRWGAHAKVDQLRERYPQFLATQAEPDKPLDVTSLERAQSVLRAELNPARLLRQLISLLLQNAGARRGFLLRESQGKLLIEAGGEVDVDNPLPKAPIALESYDRIATAVARFVARTGEAVILGDAARDPQFASDPYVERDHPRSILCFPLEHQGETVQIVYLENDRSPDVFSAERAAAVRLLASQAAAAIQIARLYDSLKQEVDTRRRAETDLRRALDEVATLKDRLEAENVYLQEEIGSHFEEIIGDSDAMRKVLYKVEQVAATDATVLILGETGTGKELIARAVHRLSPRRERPLVKVNCAALPANLIESELFGHEKGAFTGALSRKAGRFELADSGTLFLDEIGDLPLELQAKLLRVLQEGEFERLGSAETQRVDVRIIAATNRDLERGMVEGTFRSDLYYRLTVFPVELPPLRERRGDVPLLVRHFIHRKRAKLGSQVERIPHEAMERLAKYAWRGNVRELENVVERALILSPGAALQLEESFAPGKESTESPERLVDLERIHIRRVLAACDWKIKGQGNAAERLGITPVTLRSRMKKFGLNRPS